LKVLAITNLYAFPWDGTRGMFNQQQFTRLARHVDLRVLVAVPWPEVLAHWQAYRAARRQGRRDGLGIDYVIFWYPPRLLQRLHPLWFFLSLVTQRPITLFRGGWDVLLGSWAFPDGVASAAIGRIARVPVVMKVHGTDVNDYLERPWRGAQIVAAACRSAAVLAVSEALRVRLALAGVPASHITVLRNGVDNALFFPQLPTPGSTEPRLRMGMAVNARLLLFVGNLKLTKGCRDLLEAFMALPDRPRRLHLAFIGDGPAAAVLRQQIAGTDTGTADRVRLIGKCSHDELADWYRAADLVCLPSHAEGVPNVLLEAMACGTPVVATRVGGIPEVVPEFAGALIPPHDAVALTAALQAALDRPWDRSRIAAYARQFSWDTNVQGLVSLLQRAAGPTVHGAST
jgi:glycosyltransferase involved in cell wall biosynthesis